MPDSLKNLLVLPSESIIRAMEIIDTNSKGLVIVTDKDNCILGTVTDGDIRRAILAGRDLNMPVSKLLENRPQASYRKPITALNGTDDAELLEIMNKHNIRHIPIVDEENRVISVSLMSDIIEDYRLPISAVIMAGGFGSRLQPLTDATPKPMLPLGDKPLLQRTIEKLEHAGIHNVNLTTHYKSEIIKEHFGNGEKFGVEINYVSEDQPLGTAGSISLLKNTNSPLLIINGDILTSIDYRAMLNFHKDNDADMTVAVKKYDFKVPYGVVKSSGVHVTGLLEKPVMEQFINAGIYLINPDVKNYIPSETHYDMTDLIKCLLREKRTIVCFPVREYWLDIGQLEDYKKAQKDLSDGAL